jgi:ABC-2 type transport system ATP-binding protein
MPAIEVEALSKSFDVARRDDSRGPIARRLRRQTISVRAVEAMTFTVERGEMTGFIGPNGAGKSTTIKMLTGILVPSSGHVRVAGLEPTRRRTELASHIGVVFGQRTQLWWDLPLRDSFELLRHIYHVDRERHRANLARCVDILEMGDFLQTPVRQLSLGQRMRGEVTAALLHDPEILFLDEPTIGLDVVAKARIREFLVRVNRELETTILLTTHDMGDIERICRRVMIVDRGGLVYDGGLEQIKERFGGERRLVVDLAEVQAPLVVANAEVERVDGPRQWLRFRREDTSAADLIAQVVRLAQVVDISIEEPPIEDIVRRMYESGASERVRGNGSQR